VLCQLDEQGYHALKALLSREWLIGRVTPEWKTLRVVHALRAHGEQWLGGPPAWMRPNIRAEGIGERS